MRALDSLNNKNDPNAALTYFDKAILYDNQNAMAYYYRADLKVRVKNNHQAALPDLREAKKYAEQQGNKRLAEAAEQYINYLEELIKQGN